MPFRKENRHLTLSILLIVVGLMLVFAAFQLYIMDRDDEDRMTERAALLDCLDEWSTQFSDVARARSAAIVRLEKAQDAKDEATDKVFVITSLARQVPPKATEEEFDAALVARVKAARHLRRVQEKVATVREENPYETPKETCADD